VLGFDRDTHNLKQIEPCGARQDGANRQHLVMAIQRCLDWQRMGLAAAKLVTDATEDYVVVYLRLSGQDPKTLR
jgi:hypothetical protein